MVYQLSIVEQIVQEHDMCLDVCVYFFMYLIHTIQGFFKKNC